MSKLSPSARSLIEEARVEEDPSDADRRRVRKALFARIGGAVVATSVASGTASGAAAATGAAGASAAVVGSGLVTKIVLVVALVAASGTTGVVVELRSSERADPGLAPVDAADHAVAASPTRVLDAPARIAEPTLPATAPLASAVSAPAVRAMEGRSKHGAAPAPTELASGAPPSNRGALGLSEEVSLLRAAQAELSAGRAGSALALLDAHESGFAEGALREERLAARVVALCGSGQVEEGRVRAARFVQDFPKSVLVARVRTACRAK